MNEKQIAGMILAMADGHYRRALYGVNVWDDWNDWNDWQALAQEISKSADSVIQHTHRWSYKEALA